MELAFPLLFVSPSQVNAQVPWSLAGMSQVQVVVTNENGSNLAVTANLGNVAPATAAEEARPEPNIAARLPATIGPWTKLAALTVPQGAMTGAASRLRETKERKVVAQNMDLHVGTLMLTMLRLVRPVKGGAANSIHNLAEKSRPGALSYQRTMA